LPKQKNRQYASDILLSQPTEFYAEEINKMARWQKYVDLSEYHVGK